MTKLSEDSLNSLEASVSYYQEHVHLAADYLEARGIDESGVDTYRLGVVPDGDLPLPEHDEYRGRLAIPYLTQGGIVNIKFRCLKDHSCKDAHHAKYNGLPGRNNLYNVRALFDASDTIAVCEGELDALLLSLSGVPAVGIPGASAWQKHYRYIFADFTRIVVFTDGDEAGKKLGATLREAVGAIPVRLPVGKDVTDMIVGGEFEWLLSRLNPQR